jgi:hypothetical protein
MSDAVVRRLSSSKRGQANSTIMVIAACVKLSGQLAQAGQQRLTALLLQAG